MPKFFPRAAGTLQAGLLVLTLASAAVFLGLSAQPAAAQGPAPQTAAPVTFGRAQVVIETAAGTRLPLQVEVAETPDQLHQGLMFRESIPDAGGMLFLLGAEITASFWMRNTFIPLDMLFIAHDGRISSIHHRAAPGSTAIISSREPVTGVLEINGGLAQRLGIRAGDRLIHPAFRG
jgi:uncharacterized membrane protein (UPF0127 family)